MKIKSLDLKQLGISFKSPFVIFGLTGIILLCIAEIGSASKKDLQASANVAKEQTNTSAFGYEEQLEQRLTQLISQMSGAGNTQVMVTLSAGEETIYATDWQQKGEGDITETHVFSKDGAALSETTLTPAICGVAVICEGGDDITTVARITEMLSALLDLPTNRISVQKMK